MYREMYERVSDNNFNAAPAAIAIMSLGLNHLMPRSYKECNVARELNMVYRLAVAATRLKAKTADTKD